MKRVSLANLAVNAPLLPQAAPARAERKPQRPAAESARQQVNKITSKEDNEAGTRVQVAFRMDKDAYKDLKRMALDEDTTVNELMVRAINELRERKGLKKLAS
jgi:hypothetical protein